MIVIKVAKINKTLDDAGRLRWLVYKIQDGKFPGKEFPNNIMLDKYDTSGYSTVFVAYKVIDGNEIPIATIRLTKDSKELELPLVDNYDIKELRRKRKFTSPLFSVGMLAVDKNYKRTRGLLLNLVRFLTAQAIEQGCEDVVATINWEIEKMLSSLGLNRFADEFWSSSVGNWVIPIYGTVAELEKKIHRRILPPELFLFASYKEIEEMVVYKKGEILCREGERGATAFVIMGGSVNIWKSSKSKKYLLRVVGPDSLVGEMALLEDKERSATIEANADETAVLILERKKLLKVIEDPNKALTLLSALTERICRLDSRINIEAVFLGEEEVIIPLPTKLLSFVKELESREYKEGDIICEEGTPGEEAFIIEKGKVQIKKDKTTIAILPQGSLFGEIALIRGGKRSATVKVITPKTKLRVLRKKDLLGNKEFLKYLCLLQSLRVRKMNELITAAEDKKGKICDNLIKALLTLHLEEMWKDFWEEGETRGADWLAGQVGVSSEILLPYINQLKKGAIIKQEETGEITVLDVEKLKDFIFEIEI